jgi:hypothetical protein
MYAKFREDKPAEKGYSPELIGVSVNPKYYDNLDANPLMLHDCHTYLDHFERQIRNRKDAPFLGTRVKLNEKEFGEYEWKSYGETELIA